jgi:broad specificity phosphatase PhoE
MSTTVIDLIRHGMPQGGHRIRGNGIDDPLSDEGWSQMRASTSGVHAWQRIVTSPMQRCREFAQWLATRRKLPLSIEPRLREVGFGAWEGIARAELKNRHREEYEAFYRDPVNNRPPGAESLDDFGRRVADAFEKFAATPGHGNVLIVAHAGVIRAAIGHVLQVPPVNWYRLDVANAGITRFIRDGHDTHLVFHNWLPRQVS